MAEVRVPTLEYTGFYYGEIIADLIQYCRDKGLGIDESPEEPFIQILRSIAVGGHLNNTLLDLVANELYLPTAKLRDSVVGLLKLIDYHLSQPTPASATLVHKLSQSFSASITLIEELAMFATRATLEAEPIEYEHLEAYSTIRTDEVGACFAYDDSGAAWTDHTVGVNTPGAPFAVGWGAGATPGDCLYIGHPSIAWDKLRILITAASVGLDGVWEYYDGDWDESNGDNVTDIGTGLHIELNGFLGTSSRATTVVRVRCNETGVYEDCKVAFVAGINYVETTSYLGQTVPSLLASDYTVGRDWNEFTGITDATVGLTVAGTNDVDYTLPKNASEWWAKTTVNGYSAYWVRFRVLTAGTVPSLDTIEIDAGEQYLFSVVTQGRSREDNPLASSTGLPDQEYTLTRFPVLDDTTLKVYVTEGAIEEEWTRADNLVSSSPDDKHYAVEFDKDLRAVIKFGDGTFGKIPLAGVDNIRAEYRSMEDQNGNVGANTIIVNRGGVPNLASTTNPRNASGWAAAEGSTATDLERTKLLGPESLKVKGRATAAQDVVELTEDFVSEVTGSTYFSRCLALEGTYGPKTVEVVVVKTGGGFATVDELTELEEYFNGNTVTKKKGVLVLNQQVVPVNYTQHTINVVGTVYGGELASVLSAIRTLLHPEAHVVNADGTEGIDWQWDFGEEVPLSMIINAVMESEPKPRNFVLTTPAADVPLATRELPVYGTITITVVP